MAKLTFTIESEDEAEMAGYMARLFGDTDDGETAAPAPPATEKKKPGRPPRSAAAQPAALTGAENTPDQDAGLSGSAGGTQADNGPKASTGEDEDDPMTAALAAEGAPVTLDQVKDAMTRCLDKEKGVGVAKVMAAMKEVQPDATSTSTIRPENLAKMLAAFDALVPPA